MLRSEKARSDLFWEGTEGRRKTETKNAQEQYDLQIVMKRVRESWNNAESHEIERQERATSRVNRIIRQNEEGKRKRDEIQARYNELKAARDRKA